MADLGGLFSGIARGAAAVGSGVSAGELRGVQQQEAMLARKQQMDFRSAQLQAMIGYHSRGLDIRQQGVDVRRQIPYLHALADPDQKGFFDRNPAARADWETRAGLRGIDPSSLPPDPNYDPTTGTLRTPSGRSYGAGGVIGTGPAPGGAAATGSSPGGPASPPPPPFAITNNLPASSAAAAPSNYDTTGDYTGPNSQPAPFDYAPPPASPFTLGEQGLAGPRTYNTPFGPAPSTQLLPTPAIPPVLSGEPAADLPPYTPPAPVKKQTPSAVDTTTGPGAAGGDQTGAGGGDVLPDPELQALGNPGFNPNETDRARAQRLTTYANLVRTRTAQMIAQHRLPVIDANGVIQGWKAEFEPLKEAAGLESTAAGTNLKQAQADALKTYAPLRNKQITATIQHIGSVDELNALKAVWDRQYHDQLVNLGQQRVDIAGKAQTSTAAMNNARIGEIKAKVAALPQTQADKADRDTIASGLKVLNAKKRSASGLGDEPMYNDADRAKWSTRVEDAMARIDARRAAAPTKGKTVTTVMPGTASPPAAPFRPSVGTSSGTTAPSYSGPPITAGERQHVAAEINNGTFSAWMQQPALQDKGMRLRAKAAYRMLTGSAWTGK